MKSAIRTFSEKIMVMIAAVALATFSYGAPPANDNFAKAMTISGTEGVLTASNVGATTEATEPWSLLEPGMNVHSVWYKWTAPSGVNRVAFYTYAEQLAGCFLFSGMDLNNLTFVAGETTTDDCFWSLYRPQYIVPGGTYYICVASADGIENLQFGWKAVKPNEFAPIVVDGLMIGTVGDGCPTNFTIPNTVTWIACAALDGDDDLGSAKKLESVVIPESVAGIDGYAFQKCVNLSSVTFNKGMYVIKDFAFSRCSSLGGKTLNLPWMLKEVTGDAFAYIGGVVNVEAPRYVESQLFSGFYNETTLNVKYFDYTVNDRVNVILHPEGGEFSKGLSLAGRIRDDESTIVEVWKNQADWNDAISRKPVQYGYVFDGFWTAKTGGKQIWDANMKYVSGTGYWSTDGKWTGSELFGMDAYAHWKPAAAPAGSWTLKYHSNNGKNDIDTQNFKVGEEKRLYYMNSRLGWEYKDEDGFNYVFMGWAKSPTGAVAYENGALVKDLAAVGKVMHIYAVWQKRAYNVCFHSNDGRNLVEYQEFRPNIAKNLYWLDSGLGWTRSGYDFLGWSKSPTSTAVVYTNGQKVNNLVAQGQTLHLYAVWRDRRWTIRYHRNYNSGDNTYEDQKIPVGASVKLLWLDSQLKWTRNGYWFKGWAKSRTAGAAYANGQTVKDLVPGGQVLHIYGAWGQKAK